MLGLNAKDTRLFFLVILLVVAAPFLMNPFPTDSGLAQFNAGYPDLMQRFVIFGIFAIGFNILFGLTGYLSFGHAAFLGAGSYAAVWMLKLLMLKAVKSNQQRMNYTGLNTRPYTLAAFVISGMYAGLAGGLMAAMDPLAGAERMQWTASGEVVLMTILGGAGTLIGPVLGAGFIKYFENIFSKINSTVLHEWFAFLPDGLEDFVVTILYPFVGKGWHLTLGLVFMLVVIFLPGGLVQGGQKIAGLFRRKKADSTETTTTPAE